jgi:hypothetical protein
MRVDEFFRRRPHYRLIWRKKLLGIGNTVMSEKGSWRAADCVSLCSENLEKCNVKYRKIAHNKLGKISYLFANECN